MKRGWRWGWIAALFLAWTGCTDRISHDGDAQSREGCECPDEDSTCVDGLCVQSKPCAESACEDGYRCTYDPPQSDANRLTIACICDPSSDTWSSCAPACTDDSDCVTGFVCHEGSCHFEPGCLTSDVCAQDEWCLLSPVSPEISQYDRFLTREVCAPAGATAPGDPCEWDTECASGYCSIRATSAICGDTSPCRSNADCPGERCVSGQCAPPLGTCQYCESPEHMCIEQTAACVLPCTTNADCDDGECRLDAAMLYCIDEPPRCAADEFFYPHDDAADFGAPLRAPGQSCMLHQTCWTDADCPDTYECYLQYHRASGYCGRPV